MTKDEHKRETGFLAGEAAIDAYIDSPPSNTSPDGASRYRQ